MPNTGDVLCSVGVQVTRVGGLNGWVVPSRITTIGGTVTDCSDSTGSEYLVARGFDFSAIPSGATILGITVKISASESFTGTETFHAQLQDSAGALIGSSKSVVISGGGLATYTYGGIADLWGAALTAAIVKDADFGVRLWFASAHIVQVDNVQIAVEYDTPGLPGQPVLTVDPSSTEAAMATTDFVPPVDEPGDVHVNTLWQIATDAAFTSLVVNQTRPDPELTQYIATGLTAGTHYYARAAHEGGGGFGAFSLTVEFDTLPAVQVGDTPTTSLVEKGQDFVEVESSIYNHPAGEVDGLANFDPEDPHPYHQLTEFTYATQAAPSVILGLIQVVYDGTQESRQHRWDELTAGTPYRFWTRQRDGHLGVWTAKGSLDVTTDAVPANAPAQPTLTVTSCARDVAVSGSTYSHPMGKAHVATEWGISVSGGSWQYIVSTTQLTTFIWEDLQGPVTYALRHRYQDEDGAWGARSDAKTCHVYRRPPVVVYTNPALGAVIRENTTISWDAYDPEELGWLFNIRRSGNNGASYATIATNQAAASTLFNISGFSNADYLYQVAAVNPVTGEVGEWSTLPVTVDRTGSRVQHIHFADYEGEELPASWVKVGSTQINWGFRDEFDPAEDATFRLGLMASVTDTGTDTLRGGLMITEWGEPDEFDLTTAFELIAERCMFYPHQFQNIQVTEGGSLMFGVGGGDQSSVMSLMSWRPAWYLGPSMKCVSENFMETATATSARYAMRPSNLGKSFQYGRSQQPGRMRIITDRQGTGVVTSTSDTMTTTTPDRVGGQLAYTDDEGILGRNRVLYVMHQQVRRGATGGSVGWFITTRIYGAGATLTSTRFISQTDAGGRSVVCGCVGLGFQDLEQHGVGRAEGIIFTDMTLRTLSTGACATAPTCEADWDVTLFEDDDVTPWYGSADAEGNVEIADFYDRDTCPRPFLKPPMNFSQFEIDFPAGASTVGSIMVGVVDKRLDPEDQDSGIVTAKIANALGRRLCLRRWREDLGMVIVFDGIVTDWRLDPNLSTYYFQVQDPRVREIDIKLFERNETFSVYPDPNPVEPYGILPNDAGYLLPPAAWDSNATFNLMTPPEGDQGVHYGFIPLTAVPRSYIERWAYEISHSVIDVATDYQVFEGITPRWRPLAGSAWTYLRDMPAPANPAYGNPFNGSLLRGNAIMFGLLTARTPRLFISSTDPADLPEDGQTVELQILAAKTTEQTPFMWDRGSAGDLALEIYEGQHTPFPPRMRYSEDEFLAWAAATPRIRFIRYAPAENWREWIQENVYGAMGAAPSFDQNMRIMPVTWELPPSDEELTELDPDFIVPVGDYGMAIDSVINKVEYTYHVESLVPDDVIADHYRRILIEAAINHELIYPEPISWYERLIVDKVTRVQVNAASTFMGVRDVVYAPDTVRGFGDLGHVLGEALAILISGYRPAHLMAEHMSRMIINRFSFGAAEYDVYVLAGMAHGVTFDPTTLDLRVGQWVKVRAPWLPEFSTGFREHYRYMQIKSITDPEIKWRRIRLVDGGPVRVVEGSAGEEEEQLTAPTMGALSEGPNLQAIIPISDFPAAQPADYVVRVEYAIVTPGGGAPDPTSGDWLLAGYVSAEGGSVQAPGAAAGYRTWARARGEAVGWRPSPWTTPLSLDFATAPALSAFGAFLDGEVPRSEWRGNAYTQGVLLEYSIGTIGHSASYSTHGEFDVDQLIEILSGQTVDPGEEVLIRGTPYPTWSAGAGVSGTPGAAVVAQAYRTNPDAPVITSASLIRSNEGTCPSDYLRHVIAWTLGGTLSGHSISIYRYVDGEDEDGTLVASGETGSSYEDEITDHIHDPATGTAKVYRYEVVVVRSSDSAEVSFKFTPPLTDYRLECL